jgi:hypothetical protein
MRQLVAEVMATEQVVGVMGWTLMVVESVSLT